MYKNYQTPTRKRSLSNSILALLTAGTALAAMGSVHAQSFAPHAYIGGAYGVTNAQGDFNGQVFSAGQSLTGGNAIANIRSDRSDNGGKFFAGYQFHRNLAAELSYVDFGKFNGGYQFSGPNNFTRQYGANWRADGIALDLVASAEVLPKLSVSGRVGLMRSSLKYSHATVPAGLDPFNAPTDHQTRPHFGVGLGYDITPAIGAQLGWERTTGIGRNFSFSNADPDRSNGKLNYDLVSLGLTYRFR
ncbi:MAG: outer membrane beta-barrel protein [Casimicrobium sp.]